METILPGYTFRSLMDEEYVVALSQIDGFLPKGSVKKEGRKHFRSVGIGRIVLSESDLELGIGNTKGRKNITNPKYCFTIAAPKSVTTQMLVDMKKAFELDYPNDAVPAFTGHRLVLKTPVKGIIVLM